MDTVTRLKTKIGEHEFDAEGSPEYVREQFQAWQELVKLAATMPPTVGKQKNYSDQIFETPMPVDQKSDSNIDAELTKVMQVDGRYISLMARIASVYDAVLMMLYGQKVLRSNDSVTGAELLSGLESTGGFGAPRLDRILDKLAADGDVTSFGVRRGKKYRLTNVGVAKARAIAGDLIKSVA